MKIIKLSRTIISGSEAGKTLPSKVIFDDEADTETFGFPKVKRTC